MDSARSTDAMNCASFSTSLPYPSRLLAALTIFNFMFCCTLFVWPLIITNSSERFVLEVGLTMFQSQYTVEYGPVMAGHYFGSLPLIIVYLLQPPDHLRHGDQRNEG